jgi:hypothetical protein
MWTGIPDNAFEIPLPRHTGGRVLYLDIDGVLNPSNVYFQRGKMPVLLDSPGHALFEHAGLLDTALRPYPSLRIVLSTSWARRYKGSLPKIGRYLTPGLRARIVGSTWHSRMLINDAYYRCPRGMQIWMDVVRRRPVDWLALDDDYVGWPTWCLDKLVKTDDVRGISAPGVLSELRMKLAAMYARNW